MGKIADRIRSLREDRKMTQKQIADKLGLSINAVSQWERGICVPSAETVIELCSLFECSADYLLGISDF
ncbi:MAG: helix-turn-helix domain-containing protein [Firmicutes bacterium]|nr:helix-turn-helix domain-containing protein [Bacillota bacterium]